MRKVIFLLLFTTIIMGLLSTGWSVKSAGKNENQMAVVKINNNEEDSEGVEDLESSRDEDILNNIDDSGKTRKAVPTPQKTIDDSTENNVVTNPSDILVLVNKNRNLPPDYIPDDLVIPDVPFAFKESLPKKLMRKEAAAALEELFAQAKKDNINLLAQSGFRSYQRQEAIFASNVKRDGEEKANQFSARPGQSEHQTGLAMDVTTESVGFQLTTEFAETREGKWLREHAADYGFIIRYPLGKEHITGYQFEPWHIRYVGKKAAKEITAQDITLEEYLNALQIDQQRH